jgi:hypoxanthine phosphoribosyltransferase
MKRAPEVKPGEKPPRRWRADIERVLIGPERLARRVRELARQIERDFADGDLVAVAVLNGTICFLPDLMRQIGRPLEMDLVGVSSYGTATESSGSMTVTKAPSLDLRGRDVLLVDDILDSGRTLCRIVEMLREKGPRRIATCVLLDKPARRVVAIEADYVGFTVPDCFVVGYGLDYAQKYRNLPFVGELRREIYTRLNDGPSTK